VILNYGVLLAEHFGEKGQAVQLSDGVLKMAGGDEVKEIDPELQEEAESVLKRLEVNLQKWADFAAVIRRKRMKRRPRMRRRSEWMCEK
jgi:hypothetical protein